MLYSQQRIVWFKQFFSRIGLYVMYDESIQAKFTRIAAYLDEKTKRLWCANEALALGRGGITAVSRATGVSRTTITAGIRELAGKREPAGEKIL